MKTAKITLKLEKKGTLEHIHVTLGGTVVPFKNGAQSSVEMEVATARPHLIRAEVYGQPGGSIQVSVAPGDPKIPISHLKSEIDDGQVTDISFGEFIVDEDVAAEE